MQQDSYLEESVTMDENALKGGKSKYIVCSVISWTSVALAILSFFLFWISFVSAEKFNVVMLIALIPVLLFIASFLFFRFRKDRYVFDCDYIFVSGSVRVAKVMNGVKRRALTVFECSNLESVGQYDSEKYKSYSSMPGIKKIIATPNLGYHDDKIFYCYYPHDSQKTLLLFEPSNLMLLSISKSARKNIFNQ